MKVVPYSNAVLCKQLNSTFSSCVDNGIVFQKEQMPLYVVTAVGQNINKISPEVGDVIVTDAQPTKINVDGTMLFLIRDEYIAGKVET